MMSRQHLEAKYGHLIGQSVGDLTLVSIPDERGDKRRVMGTFACSCGAFVLRPLGRIFPAGKPSHCGCQTDHGAHRTHGMRNSREYSSWMSMKARCLNPTSKDYPKYGRTGVQVHPEWVASFEAFFAHVGLRPEGTTLDRIEVRGNYVPGNVRWATYEKQASNRRKSKDWIIRGLMFSSAAAAARHFGVTETTIYRWVRGNTDLRRGSFTPPREDCHEHSRG